LNEVDCQYLIDDGFKEWKKYIMNQHFRIELNIGAHEPLPRIIEDKRGEDDIFSEGDPKEKYKPVNEEEKKYIEDTRGKLSLWFPY
jgi:hypothetical protein